MRFDAVPPDLLRRASEQAPGAFDELCTAVQVDLYAFIFSHLRNHDDTDEVLLECLYRLHRYLAKLDDLTRFPWWLMKMAVNQCATLKARHQKHDTVELEENLGLMGADHLAAATPPASPRESAQRNDMRRCVNEAVATLPPRQRSAIVLFELEHQPISEIARMLECSEGTVKFNLHEGRKKLRVILTETLADDVTSVPREVRES